jgi:hypothetical protein
MIARYLVICSSCSKEFILRAVLPKAKNSPFSFPCPVCKIRLKGEFKLDCNPIKSDVIFSNFSKSKSQNVVSLPIVTISTEIPIHKLHHDKPLLKGGSPFLWFAQNMSSTFFDWYRTVEVLYFISEKQGKFLEQLVNYASIESWNRVKSILAQNLDEDIEKINDHQVIYLSHRMLSAFYQPLIKLDEMVEILEEYYFHLNNCLEKHTIDYKNMLNNYYALYGFSMFKKQVYETYYKILMNFDSFIAGLFYENTTKSIRKELMNYRLFRDDFGIVKSLYQDIFELNSKAMLYVGSVINLSKRNNSCDFASGIKSCNKFRKLKSFQKLKVLDEFVLLKKFMGKVSRPMRNSIGHFGAEYDYISGDLVFEDNSIQNYIEFLGQFSWSVKSMWFLLALVEKVEIDRCRLASK